MSLSQKKNETIGIACEIQESGITRKQNIIWKHNRFVLRERTNMAVTGERAPVRDTFSGGKQFMVAVSLLFWPDVACIRYNFRDLVNIQSRAKSGRGYSPIINPAEKQQIKRLELIPYTYITLEINSP